MECIEINNLSGLLEGSEPENVTGSEQEQQLLENVRGIFYNYGLPIVCMFGIIGNVLNLAILTRRKLRKSYRTVEQSANVCLIALALSDLMFCLFAFPTTFLPTHYYKSKGFILYYGMYSTAIINMFIMSSTWLTVTMATERYIAICHPLNNRCFMTLSKTKRSITLVYILSMLFNIPVLWRYQIQPVMCGEQLLERGITINLNETMEWYMLKQVPLGDNTLLANTYRVMWAIVGNFIPLILLVGFNICICRKIHKSYKLRQKFHCKPDVKDPGSTLTITLIVIVVMFFILVAPSEIVLHVAQMTDNQDNTTYRTVEVIMNFLQSVNFSVNFILYCIISQSFRKTLRHIVCCNWYNTRKYAYKFSMTGCAAEPLRRTQF